MAIEKRSILGNEKVVGRQSFFCFFFGVCVCVCVCVCFGGQFSYPGYQKNETGIFRRKFPLFFKNIRQFFFLNI